MTRFALWYLMNSEESTSLLQVHDPRTGSMEEGILDHRVTAVDVEIHHDLIVMQNICISL